MLGQGGAATARGAAVIDDVNPVVVLDATAFVAAVTRLVDTFSRLPYRLQRRVALIAGTDKGVVVGRIIASQRRRRRCC